MAQIEQQRLFSGVYSGLRVLVTGHTGFKGSWLCTWLLQLGAKVAGYSSGLPSNPSSFQVLGLSDKLKHYEGDIRDREKLGEVLDEFCPDVVFHLAAQALVRRSYAEPHQTFEVNALGTLSMLECVRQRPEIRAAVFITSDKCYKNVEWVWGYRETDHLGGEDPYSGSKACAEIISHSYFHSFFSGEHSGTRVATARAGNVIGGGDWAFDRIVPDCVRAWSRGEAVILRNPSSTRPWQHVLEPLSGYLWLGVHLFRGRAETHTQSYNFGPDSAVNQSVESLIRALVSHWPGARWEVPQSDGVDKREATLLKLSCDKALAHLQWRPVLTFDETVNLTGSWYRRYYETVGADMFTFTMEQLCEYCQKSSERTLPWTQNQ